MGVVIDLSHSLQNGMPVFPGSEKPLIKSIFSVKPDGFNEHTLYLSTHTGTHLDAPYHLLDNGKSVTELPVEKFMGKAFICTASDSDGFSVHQFEEKMDKYGLPDFVLFHTAWDRYWGSERYFTDFSLPSTEFFKTLADLKIKGVGIDAISIDPVTSKELSNHHAVFSSGLIIIENLTQLGKLPESIFDFFCFPLKIANADGSPVRAIAHLI